MTIHLATLLLVLGTPPADDPTDADLIAAHNRERAERKLPPLVAEPRLTAAARAHAADMAARKVMSHEGKDGSTPADRVKRAKYVYLRTGENVAEGQESVASVMESWMNSPHHRENILGDFSEVGVAVAKADDGTPYWCVDFGLPLPKLDPAKAEAELADRLNHVRADASAQPLRVSPKLSEAARAIAADNAAAQTGGPKPGDPFERIKATGYRFQRITDTGTFGSPTPEATLKVLLDSPKQKETLLGKEFSDLGVGYALNSEGRPAWIVILAKPLP